MAIYRSPQQHGRRSLLWLIVPSLFAVAITVAVAALFVGDGESAPELDADLCPSAPDDIVHRAALLFDLRKPATVAQGGGRGLAGDALYAISAELGARTELTVFAVGSDEAAALQPLARLCKPYDRVGPAVAKVERQEEPDCGDRPAQLTDRDLEDARQFCARRTDLRNHIDDLAAWSSVPVENAFVMEAIEKASLALAADPGPKSLYVFSDLLAHADWYSHIELGWEGWDFAGYVTAREGQDAQLGPRPQAVEDLSATLYYVPREGVTDVTRAKAVHRQFWRDYFVDVAGGEPRFVELQTAQGYSVAPPKNQVSEVETAMLERQRLRRQLEAAQQELAELTQRRAEQRRQQEARDAPPSPASPEDVADAAGGFDEADVAAAEPPEVRSPAPPDEAAPATPPSGTGNAETEQPGTLAATETTPTATVPVTAPDIEITLAATETTPNDALSATDAVTCEARLLRRFGLRAPAYPGRFRVDYGSATVTLSYTIDEEGNTADESIEIVTGASSATKPTFFDLFADEARGLVERYRYEFDEPSDGNCEKRQRVTRQFVYRYDR